MPARKKKDPEATKAAILEAAGSLFADRGFAGTTARQVAAVAGVALSAIPYHFGTMEALYAAVLGLACQPAKEAEGLALEALRLSPFEGLCLAARWALLDANAAGQGWQLRLLLREEFDPSPSFAAVLEQKIVPEWEWLCTVVGRAAGEPKDSAAVKFGTIVLYTVALSFVARSSVIDRLAKEVRDAFGEEEARVAQCLAELTIAAVERYAQRVAVGVAEVAALSKSAKKMSRKERTR